MSRLSAVFVCCLLAACARPQPPVVVHPLDRIPEQLSAWGVVLADGNVLKFHSSVLPYDLNTPLFTDYALKLRTVWMPPGKAARYDANQEFEFPVGTIISKTFHYEKAAGWSVGQQKVVRDDRDAELDDQGRLNLDDYTLIETRLLVRYENGWQAFPYIWNAMQTEAWLEPAGDVRDLTLVDASGELDFLYVIPDANQCAACHAPDHTDADIRPIGLKARHLNRAKQIERWQQAGVITGVAGEIPAAARWAESGSTSLQDRARAYLDINCAHCHNSAGAADTSGLHLNIEAPLDRHFGICKSPTAVGQGSGDRLYDIHPGKPEESIMIFRMDHTDPAIAMPELGRSTVHTAGVLLISEWIKSLEGDC